MRSSTLPAQTTQLMPQVINIESATHQQVWGFDFTKVDQHEIAIDNAVVDAPANLREHIHRHHRLGETGEKIVIRLGVH